MTRKNKNFRTLIFEMSMSRAYLKYIPSRLVLTLKTVARHKTFFLTSRKKGIAGSIHAGGTVAIADKFSASNYWKEVFECNAKYIHYIGEMMRYVVESPQSPYDTAHGVKVAAGSQLRYDVWPKLTVKIK